MKTYFGIPSDNEVRVAAGDGSRKLHARADLVSHSETFAWGGPNAGASQLALAIVADATGDDELARKVHQRFKWRTFAEKNSYPAGKPWQMTDEQVLGVIEAILQTETSKDVAAARRQVDREMAPIEREGGPGIDPTTRGIVWDTTPTGQKISHREED
jgi:hypothetical protein